MTLCLNDLYWTTYKQLRSTTSTLEVDGDEHLIKHCCFLLQLKWHFCYDILDKLTFHFTGWSKYDVCIGSVEHLSYSTNFDYYSIYILNHQGSEIYCWKWIPFCNIFRLFGEKCEDPTLSTREEIRKHKQAFFK